MKRIAINGMGRIGRASLKVALETEGLTVVAVNDILPIDNLAYLLKYDSTYGPYKGQVSVSGDILLVDGTEIPYFQQRNPEDLPWKDLNVDVVIESTGIFTQSEDAAKHLNAGVKTVVISAPTKSQDVPTVVHGVSSSIGKSSIFSCASCTTNNISPIVEILGRTVGIHKAIMTTIHSYTASQSLMDGASPKNYRMGRAAADNLVPTSTGAAIATTKTLPEFVGKFDGVAIRVPAKVGSISDMTFVTKRSVTPEEINEILEVESSTERYREVLATTREPLVSSDIIGSPYASIADLNMTRVVDGDLLKIMAWYDNEWGFTHQMIRLIKDL
jgi:glyceraldehyde 3-phosphate dehydrogenase